MLMKYVVTGGAGFIGSNLVDALIKNGHQVSVIDNLSTGRRTNLNPRAQFYCLDICGIYKNGSNWDEAIEACDGADGIFHLAALARVQPSIDSPAKFHSVNVTGTLNMLLLAKECGVRRFVYSASSSAYGEAKVLPTPETHPTDPLSPYGIQKLMGEQYCRVFSHCYSLETVSLRYFNIYGDRQSLDGAYRLVMGIFIKQRLEGAPLTVAGSGEQRRDFTYVGDAIRANILAMESSRVGAGESINIGNGENRSVNDLADLIGGPRVAIDSRQEPSETLADNRLALELLGWSPSVSLEEWLPSHLRELDLCE